LPYIEDINPLMMHKIDNSNLLNEVKIKKCIIHDIDKQIFITFFLPYLSGRGVITIHPKIAPMKNPEPIRTKNYLLEKYKSKLNVQLYKLLDLSF
jgi:hypothetical protein